MRAVVDTNVLFEGLTRKGTCGRIIDAWATEMFLPCVSTALALEYEDVLSRKIRGSKGAMARKALQALLRRCVWIPIHFSYRPASPDRNDDLVVDCVLNSGAVLVTRNRKNFRAPAEDLGFSMYRPGAFLDSLTEGDRP